MTRRSAPAYEAIPPGTPPQRCRGPNCGAMVYWVPNSKGKRVPVSTTFDAECWPPSADQPGVGVSHFLDCPDANNFSKSGRRS